MIEWTEPRTGMAHQARWRSENGSPAPTRVRVVDDTLTADAAFRLASEGTAMLWQGDFQNARQLLQALARRTERKPRSASKKAREQNARAAQLAEAPPSQVFHLHRQAQAQRARTLGMVLVPVNGDYSVPLRRAPDFSAACTEAWGPADGFNSVVSLRELLGLVGAHEWRRKGVEIPALGEPPLNRIHPHYGVFSPVRGEYVDLVAKAPLPEAAMRGVAFDIGVGTGVLSAVLSRRGVARIVATDQDPRALACARENLTRLKLPHPVEVIEADLFPPGRAALAVCNPPWLPARAATPIEHAIYDEDSRMLRGFFAGLADHLEPDGEGWLIMSDFAEHLGLRTREQLLGWMADAKLRVIGRHDIRPRHGKAQDATDPLAAARAAEVTSLWRLGHN